MDKQAFSDKANRLTVPFSGKRRAFWFYTDFVEFNLINHQYGKEKGTKLLEALEDFLNEIPEVVVCRRIFADQFVFAVLTDEPKSDEEIVSFWEESVRAFLEEQQKEYPECHLQICCGICPMTGEDAMIVIDNASMARKEARKTLGRRPVVYTEELLENIRSRQKKELSIASALEEGRFTYFLQPIVNLKTGKIVGAEALVRQISPEGKIIFPDEFLPIMEDNGEIIGLDFMVLEMVCRGIADRQKQGLAVVRTSVNLSRRHLADRTTAEQLHAVAQRCGVGPELLDFELTETIPVSEFSEAKILIDKLRNFGYQVSIDDYGSGYTGITVWQDLDFDILKLDRKFLQEDGALKVRNKVLIPSTIDVANQMNIAVVSEGVEREDQCRSLMSWGCQMAQGFYFSRAVPPEEFYQYYEESEGSYPLPFRIEISDK